MRSNGGFSIFFIFTGPAPQVIKPIVPVQNNLPFLSMQVEFEGERFDLKAGENYLPDIEIKDGEHVMTFTGHGIVTVSYRGGSL